MVGSLSGAESFGNGRAAEGRRPAYNPRPEPLWKPQPAAVALLISAVSLR
jgi:hypothetical protein